MSENTDPTAEKAFRVEIDKEVGRGLLLINGGGAVSLLALLPTVFEKTSLNPLAIYILYGLLSFAVGLLTTVLHTRFRRLCDQAYRRRRSVNPESNAEGSVPCISSRALMWASFTAFTVGVGIVFYGGMTTISQ